MIGHLTSPSVCVVDDEPDDYEPILDALNLLHVSAVHIKGDLGSLPAKPFTRLRLVFLDLHLAGTVGRDAAAHTANAFINIVSVETAPVIVVIWSKYADDPAAPEDDESEAQLFVRTLAGAEPRYEGRLIFVEMAKPRLQDRPAKSKWTRKLKAEIAKSLEGQPAIEALWAWESMVQDGCTKVAAGLTNVTKAAAATKQNLSDSLKNAMQSLVQAQGKGDITDATAPVHLTSVLSHLLSDRLEHPDNGTLISGHGTWLSKAPTAKLGAIFSTPMNSFLLAADVGKTKALYTPGTVYSVTNENSFKKAFGEELTSLVKICGDSNLSETKWANWVAEVKPIVIEISPVCDVAQAKRVNALLVAGLVIPMTVFNDKKKADSITFTPPFRIHWQANGWTPQDAALLLCHTYRLTVPHKSRRSWLKPWFRLRELPVTAVRNANAAHAARVGYISVE